jgi:hypothetical protein
MKFFRRSLLRRILPSIRSTGWIWDTEVLVAIRRVGAVVQEVPIVTIEVPGRATKVSWFGTSLAMSRELLQLRLRLGRAGRSPEPRHHEAQADAAVPASARPR